MMVACKEVNMDSQKLPNISACVRESHDWPAYTDLK